MIYTWALAQLSNLGIAWDYIVKSKSKISLDKNKFFVSFLLTFHLIFGVYC